MNEENKNNYYAIIPATVRYNKDLKPNEKLLYGEITALANSKGFCFASNRYFAELYKVTIHTVSQWISHLEKLGYVNIELIKDDKKEIKERRIYISDTPYIQKDTYPYVLKSTYPIYKKVQDNNINIKIDDLFLFIINNSEKISNEFYSIIKHLEFNYTTDILSIMKEDKITIRADCRKIKEEEFARQVADRVRLSIRQEDAQKRGRMEKLTEKLQNGSYQIDAARIADRMMIDERGWVNGEDKGADR